MATFEYKCQECTHQFWIEEVEGQQTEDYEQCPNCGSKDFLKLECDPSAPYENCGSDPDRP